MYMADSIGLAVIVERMAHYARIRGNRHACWTVSSLLADRAASGCGARAVFDQSDSMPDEFRRGVVCVSSPRKRGTSGTRRAVALDSRFRGKDKRQSHLIGYRSGENKSQ